MSNINVSMEVDATAYDIGKGLVQLASVVKKALSDGWVVSEDLPVIIASAVATFASRIQEFQQLPAEAKADPESFIKAFVVSAVEMYGALK